MPTAGAPLESTVMRRPHGGIPREPAGASARDARFGARVLEFGSKLALITNFLSLEQQRIPPHGEGRAMPDKIYKEYGNSECPVVVYPILASSSGT